MLIWAGSIPSPAAAVNSGVLASQATLPAGGTVPSPNGSYVLRLTGCNLVLSAGTTQIWTSGNSTATGCTAEMQRAGDLVVTTATGTQIWHTATSGFGGATLVVGDDGSLEISQRSRTLWDRVNGYIGDRLLSGRTLAADQYLRSVNRDFHIVQLASGGLSIYYSTQNDLNVWDNGARGGSASAVAKTVMETGGNLVTSVGGVTKWSSGTSASGSYAKLQDDGTFVVISGGTTQWSSEPTITSLNSTAGPVAGGQVVQLSGTNLKLVKTVSFGGTAVTPSATSATSVTVTTPSHSAGSVDVAVSTGGPSAVKSGAYTYRAVPAILAVTPNAGSTASTTAVRITGSGLAGASTVTIGGVAATNVQVISDSELAATAPAHAAGSVDVVVTTAGGTATKASAFTYYASPTLLSVSSSSGLVTGGGTLTLSGVRLSGTTSVKFGTASAAFTVLSGTSVQVTVPPQEAATVAVSVTAGGSTTSLAAAYTYLDPRAALVPGSYRPDASTTGLIDPSVLQDVTGVSVFDDSATQKTIWNKRFLDRVEIKGSGFTFRNCLFAGPVTADLTKNGTESLGLQVTDNRAIGLVVKDSTFLPQTPSRYSNNILGHDFSLYRVDSSGAVDGASPTGSAAPNQQVDVAIYASYIHDLVKFTDPGHSDGVSHSDGIQWAGGTDLTLIGNRIDGWLKKGVGVVGPTEDAVSTSAMMFNKQGGSSPGQLVMRNNWFTGGVVGLNLIGITSSTSDVAFQTADGTAVENNWFGNATNLNMVVCSVNPPEALVNGVAAVTGTTLSNWQLDTANPLSTATPINPISVRTGYGCP